MTRQTILITGATGFLGSYLLEAFIQQDYSVVVLTRSTTNFWRIKHLEGRYRSYNIDIQLIENVFEDQRIDCVVHTACHYGRNNDQICHIVDSNLIFGLKILDACLKFKTELFFNTDTLLQKHLNAYTLSKKQFVEWLKLKVDNIQVINLKLEHMYGPKDDIAKLIPWVILQLQKKVPEIKLTKGEQQRDFIYVEDVVSAFLTLLKKAPNLERFIEFDVGTGKLVTVKSFLEQLKESYQIKFGAVDTKMVFGAIPYREGEMMTVKVNNKGLLDLGWTIKTSHEMGLRKILNSI